MKKIAPVSVAFRKKIAALPAENDREANSRSGSIGAAARRSQATNPTSAASADDQRAERLGLVQPAVLPRTSAHTRPSEPARGEHDAGQVEAAGRARGSPAYPGEHERDRRSARSAR